MVLGPLSHGSTSILKVPGGCSYFECGSGSFGEKVSRKVLSAFRCLQVRDMT